MTTKTKQNKTTYHPRERKKETKSKLIFSKQNEKTSKKQSKKRK